MGGSNSGCCNLQASPSGYARLLHPSIHPCSHQIWRRAAGPPRTGKLDPSINPFVTQRLLLLLVLQTGAPQSYIDALLPTNNSQREYVHPPSVARNQARRLSSLSTCPALSLPSSLLNIALRPASRRAGPHSPFPGPTHVKRSSH